MQHEAWQFIQSSFEIPSLLSLCVVMAVTATILTPLEYLFPAHEQPLFVRRDLRADLAWWFFTPLLTQLCTNAVLTVLLLGFATTVGLPLNQSLLNGFGAIGQQPLWLQTVELLVLADFIDYWTHRAFHTSKLWPFHAVHHSPEEMNWISSSRVHPINDLATRTFQVLPLIALGFSPAGVIAIVPYIAFYVMFLHSNISWDFGPLRWILVSPAYHRWHHTTDREGIDKNFAGIFPLWDLMFGTAHFPHRLPRSYGVKGTKIPTTFVGQLLHPFRRRLG